MNTDVRVQGGFSPTKSRLIYEPLKPGLTYACHAGTMVHVYKSWQHHESGPVDLQQIPDVWKAAMELGFYLPHLPSSGKENHAAITQ